MMTKDVAELAVAKLAMSMAAIAGEIVTGTLSIRTDCVVAVFRFESDTGIEAVLAAHESLNVPLVDERRPARGLLGPSIRYRFG